MENTKTWIVIAGPSKARIYSTHKLRLIQDPNPKNLEPIGDYVHPNSRKKNSELVTDKMGEFGSGSFEATPPKTHEAEVFALELLHLLEKAKNENAFKDLIIISSPEFMGVLSKHMSHELQKLVSHTIEKDYTQHSEKELIQHLLTYL